MGPSCGEASNLRLSSFSPNKIHRCELIARIFALWQKSNAREKRITPSRCSSPLPPLPTFLPTSLLSFLPSTFSLSLTGVFWQAVWPTLVISTIMLHKYATLFYWIKPWRDISHQATPIHITDHLKQSHVTWVHATPLHTLQLHLTSRCPPPTQPVTLLPQFISPHVTVFYTS